MKIPYKIHTQLMLFSLLFTVMLALIGTMGILETREQSESMQSLYADRVVPLSQLKKIADMYAVNMVDTAHKDVMARSPLPRHWNRSSRPRA